MLFFFGELNWNGWPVPVPTPVEELIAIASCHTPKPRALPRHGVVFFPVFVFFGLFSFFFSSAFSFTAAEATTEGPAPRDRASGCGPASPAGGTPSAGAGSMHSWGAPHCNPCPSWAGGGASWAPSGPWGVCPPGAAPRARRLGGISMAQGVGGDGRGLQGVGIASCRHMQRRGVGHRHWLEGGQGAPYGPRLRAMHRVHCSWLRHMHMHRQWLWHRQWFRLGNTRAGCTRHRHGHMRGGRQIVGG